MTRLRPAVDPPDAPPVPRLFVGDEDVGEPIRIAVDWVVDGKHEREGLTGPPAIDTKRAARNVRTGPARAVVTSPAGPSELTIRVFGNIEDGLPTGRRLINLTCGISQRVDECRREGNDHVLTFDLPDAPELYVAFSTRWYASREFGQRAAGGSGAHFPREYMAVWAWVLSGSR